MIILNYRLWFRGHDLNLSDYDGRTPLHLSAVEGRVECVKFLLEVVKVFSAPLDR